jgi:hypothetical protein
MVQRGLADSSSRCRPPRIPGEYSTRLITEVAHVYTPQRQVYHKDPSDTFWKTVDETLAELGLKSAPGNSLRVSE